MTHLRGQNYAIIWLNFYMLYLHVFNKKDEAIYKLQNLIFSWLVTQVNQILNT